MVWVVVRVRVLTRVDSWVRNMILGWVLTAVGSRVRVGGGKAVLSLELGPALRVVRRVLESGVFKMVMG